MSQDNALFSAFKRTRETISAIDKNAVYGSSIPQPASTIKRASSGAAMGHRASMAAGSSSRMSMAPPRSGGLPRSSSGGNLAEMGMSTVKRNSTRKSFAPGSQPPPSTARRSSQYGRPSMGATNSSSFFTTVKSSVQKDPRPLKRPDYKQKMQQEIWDYLHENNFEMEMKYQLQLNALQSPTQKDFYNIFQWLYNRLDSNYVFALTKPESEVLPLLNNNLRYPYTNSITKTQLTAVGSGNTWPVLLGMLHWMMELARVTDNFASGDYDGAAEEEGISIETDKIVFRYVAKCYNAWLSENDDHEEFEKEMIDAFEERDSVLLTELKGLEEENAQLKKELDELDESLQPLQSIEKEKKTLEEDIEKFVVFIERQEAKTKKTYEVMEKIKTEIDLAEQELSKVKRQHTSLQEQVDAQGITPQDIDRMNTDREKLNQGLAQVSQKLVEAHNKLAEWETQAQSKLEELERAVSRYNKLAYQIGITPSTAPKADGKEYEIKILPLSDLEDSKGESWKLLLDGRTGYQPSQILNVDLRNEVKPFLDGLRQDTGVKAHNAMDETLKNQEWADRVMEVLADKKDELETLEAKVHSVNNEYQELKETLQAELNMSNAEMEKQAANLTQMRVNMNRGALETDQKLNSINIEYNEYLQTQARLREKLHNETQRIVGEIVDFKLHIQRNLEEYEERAEIALQEDNPALHQ